MRTIAIRTKKGGVGKTTTALNLAYYFAKIKNQQVLLVDCDSQFNLSTALGIRQSSVDFTIKDFLAGRLLSDCMVEARENLMLIPANEKISDVAPLLDEIVPEMSLRRKMDMLQSTNFQWVIFDCPPGSNKLIDNVMCYVDEVIVPLQTEYLSLEGIEQVIQEISKYHKSLSAMGVHPQLSYIIPTIHDKRRSISGEILDIAKDRYKAKITPVIHRNVKLVESPSHGQTIFEYSPNSNAAKDYKNVADFILKA